MVDIGLVADQVITGLSIGAQLFLVAIGLSLIFGVLDVLNFAHGALYMIGAYVAVTMVNGLTVFGVSFPRLGFWPGVIAALVVVGVLGALIEMGFIRRLYGRQEEVLDQLLLTFAFVLILTDLTRITFGTGQFVISPPAGLQGTVRFTDSLAAPTYRAFLVVMSLVVLGALFAVLRFTNIGRLVRATASDRDMARLLGIDVSRLYTGVFFVGALLAGLGGALAAPVGAVSPAMGNQVIINAFVVVVIGGLGSFTGAFVGAYVIGLLIAVGSIVISGAGQLLPFLAMIAVLVLKPQGLFGGEEGAT
ncbi:MULTISPECIES: branched-chain amino acid ABC transporter permease [Halorussus]|uniref:branched-chain amino acid ABC transporter permease n=1 Tax=Halorussus TaxID=1070314 RepID=UPI000E21462F|nr:MULTISPECIES: branched-chain amino acid ABC transporter permease [Halorussus]NHN57654.1 branched-chain amino acid ABC transporter permease [Halorussus sp. JP-T4]